MSRPFELECKVSWSSRECWLGRARHTHRWLSALCACISVHGSTANAQANPTSSDDLVARGLVSEPPAAAVPSRILLNWAEAHALLRSNNPRREAAAASLQRAEALAREVFGRTLPELNARAGVRYNPLRVVYDGFDNAPRQQWFSSATLATGAGLGLGMTLSAAAWAASATAQEAAKVEQLALLATHHRLVEALATALLATVSAQRLAIQARVGLAAAQERLRLTQRMAALGRATALDVHRFLQDVNATRAVVADADAVVRQTRDVLGNLLGLGEAVAVGSQLSPVALLSSLEADPACEVVSDLGERAEVSEAKSNETLAKNTVQATQLELLPEVRIETSYSLDYASLSPIPTDYTRGLMHDWRMAANLTWSVFDGGQRQARISRARAELAQASAGRRETQLAALAMKAEIERERERAQSTLRIAQDDLLAAETADALSRREYELGRGSALERVEAARWLRYAQLTVTLREIDVVHAQLRRALLLRRCS